MPTPVTVKSGDAAELRLRRFIVLFLSRPKWRNVMRALRITMVLSLCVCISMNAQGASGGGSSNTGSSSGGSSGSTSGSKNSASADTDEIGAVLRGYCSLTYVARRIVGDIYTNTHNKAKLVVVRQSDLNGFTAWSSIDNEAKEIADGYSQLSKNIQAPPPHKPAHKPAPAEQYKPYAFFPGVGEVALAATGIETIASLASTQSSMTGKTFTPDEDAIVAAMSGGPYKVIDSNLFLPLSGLMNLASTTVGLDYQKALDAATQISQIWSKAYPDASKAPKDLSSQKQSLDARMSDLSTKASALNANGTSLLVSAVSAEALEKIITSADTVTVFLTVGAVGGSTFTKSNLLYSTYYQAGGAIVTYFAYDFSAGDDTSKNLPVSSGNVALTTAWQKVDFSTDAPNPPKTFDCVGPATSTNGTWTVPTP
jgi:hypothetical protein